MSENFEALNEFEREAIESLIEEIRASERIRAEKGAQKYISDAVHEKLYELWDAFDYYISKICGHEEEECFGTRRWNDLYESISPEEFIEKINNYILKKHEKDSKELVTGDEIEVHFYEPLEHLNEFLMDDDKHLYYLNTMSDGYVMALSKSGTSTKIRVDSVKKTGKHYSSFKEFAEDDN